MNRSHASHTSDRTLRALARCQIFDQRGSERLGVIRRILFVLSNLCSAVVDQNAHLTKAALLACPDVDAAVAFCPAPWVGTRVALARPLPSGGP